MRGAGSLIEGWLEALRSCLVGGGGEACSGNTDDIGLDHHIVEAADQEKMFDIVPAQQDELPLPVEIVDVDDAEPRLPAAAAIAARHHQASARELPQDQAEKRN